MSTSLDLTVLVHSFERPNMLGECLHRLRSYATSRWEGITWELLIADDASSDPRVWGGIAYAQPDKVVFNKHRKEHGPSWTLNEAYRIASGRYVLHVESDCYLFRALHEVNMIECMDVCREDVKLVAFDKAFKGSTIPGKECATCHFLEQQDTGFLYSNRPHLSPRSLWQEFDLPDDLSMRELESQCARTFLKKRYRALIMLYRDDEEYMGWFEHHGGGKSTRGYPNAFKPEPNYAPR